MPGRLSVDPGALAFGVAAVLVGAYVRGYSGFGSALIWVSSLSLVFAPAVVVPAVFVLDIVASLRLFPAVWRAAHWRSLRWLMFGMVLGTAPGLYLLANLPDDPVRVAISIVVLGATVLIWRGFTLRAVPGPAATLGVGVSCGVLNGWTGIGGPPAILLYFSSPAAVAVSRASMVAFLLSVDVVGLAMALAQGVVTRQAMILAAVLAVPVALGVSLGHRRFVRTAPDSFRRFVFVLLALLSAAVLLRAVLGWQTAA